MNPVRLFRSFMDSIDRVTLPKCKRCGASGEVYDPEDPYAYKACPRCKGLRHEVLVDYSPASGPSSWGVPLTRGEFET